MQQILCYFTIVMVIFTLIPLIRNDFWIFRVFEYPRLQKLALNLVLLLLNLWFLPITIGQKIVCCILFFNLCYLIYQVYPFTFFGKKQLISARHPNGDDNIAILIANVYQENRKSESYLELINKCTPDVVLFVETNAWWEQKLDIIIEQYPYHIKVPLENTYGMLFYSRLAIRGAKVNYLVEDDVPSISVDVQLKSGQWVRMYGLHPKPPVPQENPRSTERDKEVLLVAKKAKDCKLPVIVMGDLNDVAWSYTTELFVRLSGLLDPRRGRGFFNSFNAKYFFLRFPLDHIFCSTEFTLYGIKRMPDCGSDHFPMWVNLQFDPPAQSLHTAEAADENDVQLANEKLNAID